MNGDPHWLHEIDTTGARLAQVPLLDKLPIAARLLGLFRDALLDLHNRVRALEGDHDD